jgi:hypothetical protein
MDAQHGHQESDSQEREADDLRQRITEVGVGITLIGVIFNIGLTIGFGVTGVPLYLRLLLAIVCPLALIVGLGLLSRRIDLLSTIPWWLTGPGPDPFERLERDR